MSVSFWSFMDSCFIGNHTTSSFLYLQQSEKIPRPEAGFGWPLTKCIPVQTSNYKINLQLKTYKTNKNQRLLTWRQGNHTKRHIQYAKVKSQKVIVWSRDSCEKKRILIKGSLWYTKLTIYLMYLIYLRRCGTNANHTVNSPFNSNKIYKFYIEGKGQAHMKFLVPIDSYRKPRAETETQDI